MVMLKNKTEKEFSSNKFFYLENIINLDKFYKYIKLKFRKNGRRKIRN